MGPGDCAERLEQTSGVDPGPGIPQQRPTSHDSLVGWFRDDINDIINPYRVDDHPQLHGKTMEV